MLTTLLFALFILFMCLGIPVAVAIGLATCIAFVAGGYDLLSVPQQMANSTKTVSLLAVPFFILAGNMMNALGCHAEDLRLRELRGGQHQGRLGPGQRARQHDLRGDLGGGAGRRGGPRHHRDQGDEAGGLRRVLQRRGDGLLGHDRADHPAQHHDGHLRHHGQRLHRRDVPGRRAARDHDRRLSHGLHLLSRGERSPSVSLRRSSGRSAGWSRASGTGSSPCWHR